MIDLLFRLPNFIAPTNADAIQVAEGFAAPDKIGFIVLAIIVGPVIALTIAAIFGRPRTFRVPGLFIGSLILLIVAIILSFAVSSVLLGFIIPQ